MNNKQTNQQIEEKKTDWLYTYHQFCSNLPNNSNLDVRWQQFCILILSSTMTSKLRQEYLQNMQVKIRELYHI